MSIMIKGMEMPPDGRYTVCITHDSNGGMHWVFQNQESLAFLKHGEVTVVQEPYGRLGDLDALHNAIAANIIGSRCGEETSVEIAINEAVADDLMIIDAQQTIIPASEEGEI